MATEAIKSTAVTNSNATPRVINNIGVEGGNIVRAVNGLVTLTAAKSTGSTYRIGKIRSSDYVDRIRLTTLADIGTTVTADLGLYDLLTHSNGGTVVDADFFASAVDLHTGAIDSDVTFESGAAGGLITNGEKAVWDCLGLSSDPGKEYDVTLTLTADMDGAACLMAGRLVS
jgi:hypothetical protein